jgi:hypothetical protein
MLFFNTKNNFFNLVIILLIILIIIKIIIFITQKDNTFNINIFYYKKIIMWLYTNPICYQFFFLFLLSSLSPSQQN